MYVVFTCMPCESYRKRLGSLLLYLCYVFRVRINSLCVDSARALWASFCFRLLSGRVCLVIAHRYCIPPVHLNRKRIESRRNICFKPWRTHPMSSCMLRRYVLLVCLFVKLLAILQTLRVFYEMRRAHGK